MRTTVRKAILIPILLTLAVLLGGCAADSGGTEAGPTTAPSTTAAGQTTAVLTTAAATTPATTAAVRRLDGPEAGNAQFVLRTGDAEVVRDEAGGTESVFIWCEIENRSEGSLTVSSLLYVTLTDSATGTVAAAPDVHKIFGQLAGIDPECATLDGEIAPGARLAGWIYGEFPTAVSGVRIQAVLSGTADAAQTEPVTLERSVP